MSNLYNLVHAYDFLMHRGIKSGLIITALCDRLKLIDV
jgi:hypothetical protein